MSYSVICSSPISIVPNAGGPGAATYFVDGVQVALSMPYCSTGWQIIAHVPPFDSSQLDPAVIVAVFSGGFLLYLVPWAAAFGFSALLKLLR